MPTLTIELDTQTEQRLKRLQTTQEKTINQTALRILTDSVAALAVKSPDEMNDEELLAYLEAEESDFQPTRAEKISLEQATYLVGTEIDPNLIVQANS